MNKIESLENWELVDAMDGRRWVGRVTSRTPLATSRMSLWDQMPTELQAMVLATGHEHVTMSPAFELQPQASAVVTVEAQNLLGRSRSSPMPQWLTSPPRTLTGVAQLPAFVTYTTQRCGGFDLAQLPASTQKGMLDWLNKAIGEIERSSKNEDRVGGDS